MKAIFHPRLLSGVCVTVLAYAGSFCVYTYVVPLLIQMTGVGASTISAFMFAYGVLAALGNMIGGRLTDRFGANGATLAVVAGIAMVVLGVYFLSRAAVGMALLVGALGLLSYAAVPALQARLLGVAEHYVPGAHGVAAGLNIAGFNAGIALGAAAGGVTVAAWGVAYTGLMAAGIAAAGLLLLILQWSPSLSSRRRRARLER